MATDFIPRSLQARITLRAISPLFAISMLVIFFDICYHKLILPCFFQGLESFLLARALSACIIMGLVSIGSITTSIILFSAAIYGFANLSRNSLASFFFISAALGVFFSSLLCVMVIAASGPRTAILALGHA